MRLKGGKLLLDLTGNDTFPIDITKQLTNEELKAIFEKGLIVKLNIGYIYDLVFEPQIVGYVPESSLNFTQFVFDGDAFDIFIDMSTLVFNLKQA